MRFGRAAQGSFSAEHEGIILDLKDFDCKPGDNLADVLELDDLILEIDNKSMTNRPDLWGHYGIAGSLPQYTGRRLKAADSISPAMLKASR